MSHDEANVGPLGCSIRQTLKDSKTELCSTLTGYGEERGYKREFASYRTSGTGDVQTFPTHEATTVDDTSDDGLIYPIASLSKPIIATGVCVMMDKLSKEEPEKHPDIEYWRLEGAWETSFTTVFNSYSKDLTLPPFPGNPTVKQLLVHFNGPASMNHILWAPDGAPLSSRDHFLAIISQYTTNTFGRKPKVTYSNANYILMALFIETVSKQSLDRFLKKYVFEPLQMTRTFLTKEDLEKHPFEARAQPHVVSSDGVRHAIPFNDMSFLGSITETSILGFHSCAADLGLFFRALLMALKGKPVHKYFDLDLVSLLQSGIGSLSERDEYGYTPCGLYTSLATQLPGSHSPNRLISPGSELSAYTMDEKSKKDKAEVFYMAGCSTGCASTIYFVPEWDFYVIVLTNTLGCLDASDIISRLCLEALLYIKPSKLGRPFVTWMPSKPQIEERGEGDKAFWVEVGKKFSIQNAMVSEVLEVADLISDVTSVPCPDVCGDNADTAEYENQLTLQSLMISGQGSERRVVIKAGLGQEKRSSGSMRFVWTGSSFRICSADKGKRPLGLSIDRFGDWSNLEFTPNNVSYVGVLSREVCSYMTDQFVRK